ncbi:MAG: hypothetical protein Kow0077_26880 [Anaerolineae bacterium]
MERQIRVLIVDDRRSSRDGLRALLATTPEIHVVGEAGNGAEAVALAEQYQPDVILMDINMPVMDGLEATRQIKQRHPEIRVVLLTMYTACWEEAVQVRADGLFVKGERTEHLLQAVLEGH